MLLETGIILLASLILGVVSGYTFGGLIYLLLIPVLIIALIFVSVIREENDSRSVFSGKKALE